MRQLLLVIFCSFLICVPSFSQVNIVLKGKEISIGSEVSITLSSPEQLGVPTSADFSTWDKIIPPDDRLSLTAWEKKGSEYQMTLTFMPFDTGTFMLPPIVVSYQNGESNLTVPIELKISTEPLAHDNLMENKPNRKEPVSWLDYLHVIIPILLLFILAVAVWFHLNRKKRKAVVPVSKIIEQPPQTLALKKLEVLEQKQLWQQGKFDVYYSELTYIFREYLEKKYKILALAYSSAEILSKMQKNDFSAERLLALQEILNIADLAKFAKAQHPNNEFHQIALDKIRDFILVNG